MSSTPVEFSCSPVKKTMDASPKQQQQQQQWGEKMKEEVVGRAENSIARFALTLRCTNTRISPADVPTQ